MNNMTFYKQMLKRNLLLIFIINIVFCTVIYYLYTSVSGSKLMKKYEAEFIQKANTIDTAVSFANELSIMMRNSTEAKEYANDTTSNPYLRFRATNFLNSSIGNIASSRLYTACFKDTDSAVISTLGTMSINFFEQKTGISLSDDSEFLKYFKYSPTFGIAITKYTYNVQPISTITFIKSDIFPGGGHIYTFTSYDIDAVINSNDGNFVITYNSEPFYYNDNISKETAEKIAGYDNLKGYKSFMRVAQQSNVIGDFKYIYAVPYSTYFMRINEHFWLALPLSTIVLILSFFLIYSITNKNYEPINNILNIINENDFKNTDDEIDTITNTILSLSTRNSKLKNIIDDYRLPVENTFFSTLLYGNISDSDAAGKLKEFGLDKTGVYVAAIVDYSNNKSLSTAISKEGILTIKETVSAFLKNNFESTHFIKIIDTDFWHQAIIASVDDYDFFINNLRHILLKLEGKLNIIIFASVGKAVNTIKDIYMSYNSAKSILLNNQLFTNHSAVCSVNNILTENVAIGFSPSTENKLIENTLSGDREKVRAIISDIVSFDEVILSKEQFSLIVILFNSAINRILFLMNKTEADIFPSDMIIYLELKSCTNSESLKKTLIKIFDKLIDYTQSQQHSNEQKISTTMIEYIHNNYMNDISLLDLAEHLNLSQSYVSRLFKSLTGSNFKEYLNHHRFLKAKELMDEKPTIKVKDVASAVGLNSGDSLSRIFLKYLGVSASDYLKK